MGTSSSRVNEALFKNRIAVKVRPFWAERSDLWFSQIEARFEIAGVVTNATKFNTVVAAIENNVLTQIVDAILHPPERPSEDLEIAV